MSLYLPECNLAHQTVVQLCKFVKRGLLQAMACQTQEQFFRLHVLSAFFDGGTTLHICENGLSTVSDRSDKENGFNLLFAISAYFGGNYLSNLSKPRICCHPTLLWTRNLSWQAMLWAELERTSPLCWFIRQLKRIYTNRGQPVIPKSLIN